MRCVLRVGVLGLSFKTASLPVREAFARAAESFCDQRAIFFPYPVVCLSTCERVEFYWSADDLAEAQAHLLAWLKQSVAEVLEHQLYTYFGLDAFLHLCRVASGLDSAVVGESDIQRQVKVAYERRSSQGFLPSCLHYAFQKALRVSKESRSNTSCSANLYSAIWEMAEEKGLDWAKARILLVGYSEWNRGLISFLQRRGVKNLALVTQSPADVRCSLSVYGREALADWGQYDVILAATTAPDYLIGGVAKKKHLIFDLGVPRNVDPVLGEQEGVSLYNIEQIDRRLSGKASPIVEESVENHALRLARIYRLKTLRGRESAGTESRLECFPCR